MIGSNTCTLYPRFVSHLPQYIHSVEDVLAVIHLFESIKMCVGNPDTCLVETWKKKLHFSTQWQWYVKNNFK